MDEVSDGPGMLAGVVEIESLNRLAEAVLDHILPSGPPGPLPLCV